MTLNHNPDFKTVTCSKCGIEAHTATGTVHRRCPGHKGGDRQPKSKGIPAANRGVWGR